jgi:hypothetical protein
MLAILPDDPHLKNLRDARAFIKVMADLEAEYPAHRHRRTRSGIHRSFEVPAKRK